MISIVYHISSLEHPELAPYKIMRRPMEHLEQGIFIAEGEKVIVRLLKSSMTIRSILLTADWYEEYHALIEQNVNTITVFIGGKKLLETIVGHSLHQSIMGLALVPTPLSSNEIISTLGAGKKTFVLVDGITNAENMGVIARNCACFGVDALLVLPTSCDPYLRRSVRNSMGNIFQLPIVYIHNTVDEIKKLKTGGIKMYGAHPYERSLTIQKIQFAEKRCLVLGAEGHGIAQNVLELCDEFVSIPMKNGVDSLNVASASAIILYHMTK